MKKFLRPRTHDEVFLDYGAGLGRVLILAAMLPFKRVIGVELSPILAAKARDNLSNANARLLCKNVEVIVADAAAFELPRDVTTIYFNNPFAGEILEKVLKKIEMSYREAPRSMRLVCNLPQESAFQSIIDQSPFLKVEVTVELGTERQCRVLSVAIPPMARASEFG
jgi:SAM-dependent methyltransferase